MEQQRSVDDWATDFDIFDEGFAADPFPVYGALREGCPVAHTERWGGQWLPTRYEDIVAITADPATYSSVTSAVFGPKPGEGNLLVAPPITSDPPLHSPARRVLLPSFSPHAVDRLEPVTRAIARRLIDGIRASGDSVVDAAERYARHIPVQVIATMLGIPTEDEDRFTGWVVAALQEGAQDPENGRRASREMLAYFAELVAARRADPTPHDDLVADLMTARMDGAPLTDKHIVGSAFLLLVAGIDTTWSSIGAAIAHLGVALHDRDRLLREPDLLPNAIEELLRVYAPVTMARIVTQETQLGGRTLCPGERVLLPFAAANHDPEVFDRPDEVVIDREHNRHLAFGVGIHRCVGSNLARMELRVALEEWLAAFPSFTVVPDAEQSWTGGQVRGPRHVPVRLHLAAP